ncbi:unnamed protein product [Bursaphelenchus xylophilus]|uniref:(pine wood nematode) hypothetical protein n=1 Tax=Bursaphelenchus xylophilus TaxID=6326 RepID=A0A1I7RQU7_BURXY|nr:unnamed protein product [Bursaphelenchus xylophilus]CAG9130679.1 unnamed protein product [Bursaphelenchus xylophilus]
MFTIDAEEPQKETKVTAREEFRLISLEKADKTLLCKGSKKELLDILASLKKFEAKINDKLIQRFRRLTRDSVRVSTVCLTIFSLYCRGIRLADHLITINPNRLNQTTFLYLLHKFHEFFWKNMQLLGPKSESIFNQTTCQLRFTKLDVTVYFSVQALHFNRLVVCKQRHMAELTMIKQQQLRKQAVEKDKEMTYSQLPWNPVDMKAIEDDFLRSELLDLDDACIIIQCAERMYQAHARGIYMIEVKRKAMDLHKNEAEVDPEHAAKKIQARTRGFLARKHTRLLREQENAELGIHPISLINKRKNLAHLLRDFPPASPLFSCIESSSGPLIPTFEVDFSFPKSIQALIEQQNASVFTSDPLENILEARETRKTNYETFDSKTETLFSKLNNTGIAILGPEQSLQFDELISFTVQVMEGHEIFYWDLRNYLYMSVVIPNVLSTWPEISMQKRNLLLVGSKQSGRHSWARAMAQKCGAVQITINGKSLPRRKRSKMVERINNFCLLDHNVFIIFDTLDIYNEKYIKKSSHIKVSLLENWTEELRGNVQIIGISAKPNLEEKVLNLFPTTVTIGTPTASEKIEVIADQLSKRLEESKSEIIPYRLIELNKSTKKLNIGMTIEKIDKKQNRRRQESAHL